MPFMKVVKNKAYFKRFQVKYRRRREGKTDYRARKRLVAQDKNKYNSPRYRFVVRFTNKDIIAQIVYARIQGDAVLTAAYAHELPRYGMPVGLTNYAAAYATGLLLARRLLTKLKLADKYKGVTEANGEDFNVEEIQDGPRPFLALLDVGLRRTTTGSKIFGALKGITDGGVEVPHSETRFVGYDDEAKKLNAEILKKYIYGGHVSDYMKKMSEEDSTKYNAHFSQYIKKGIKADTMEATWKKVHAAIRAKPDAVKSTKKADKSKLKVRSRRLTLAQRKENIKSKINKMATEKDEGEE